MLGVGEHDQVGDVYDGRLDLAKAGDLKCVANMAGRQERAGAPARPVAKVESDRRSDAGDAVDVEVTMGHGPPVPDLRRRIDWPVGVGVVDRDRHHPVTR
jgi:hypothetical protein